MNYEAVSARAGQVCGVGRVCTESLVEFLFIGIGHFRARASAALAQSHRGVCLIPPIAPQASLVPAGCATSPSPTPTR